METDGQYADTYGMQLLAGSFLKDKGDSTGIVINEAALHALGWKTANEAIGQPLQQSGVDLSFHILGVVKDFHLSSMQEAIPPVCFTNLTWNPRYRYMSIRLGSENMSCEIEALHQRWKTLLPGAPFEYTFMDDTLAKLYKTELQMKQAARTASSLSIIIVLLGVLGLISISIQKRLKEIGIRKVLGSSEFSIVFLFLKEFLPVILIAGLSICPVAWYLCNHWLNAYTYRIEPDLWLFLSSVMILLIATVLLIVFKTIHTARLSPVKSLRTE